MLRHSWIISLFVADLFLCFVSSFHSAARTQNTEEGCWERHPRALSRRICFGSLLWEFWNPIIPDSEYALSSLPLLLQSKEHKAQAARKTLGLPSPLWFGKPLQVSEPQFSYFSDRDHSINDMRREQGIYAVSLGAWRLAYTRCSGNVSSFLLFWYPRVCCPSRKWAEGMERVLNILSVIYYFLSVF